MHHGAAGEAVCIEAAVCRVEICLRMVGHHGAEVVIAVGDLLVDLLLAFQHDPLVVLPRFVLERRLCGHAAGEVLHRCGRHHVAEEHDARCPADLVCRELAAELLPPQREEIQHGDVRQQVGHLEPAVDQRVDDVVHDHHVRKRSILREEAVLQLVSEMREDPLQYIRGPHERRQVVSSACGYWQRIDVLRALRGSIVVTAGS